MQLQAETCNFMKKETLAQVFPCGFYEISKNTFFTEDLWTSASVQLSLYYVWRYRADSLKMKKLIIAEIKI